jgi:hypothetical protein
VLLLKRIHRRLSTLQFSARIEDTLSLTVDSVSGRFGTLAMIVASKEEQIRAHFVVAQDMRLWTVTQTAPPTKRAK